MRPEQIALTLYTLRDHCQDINSLRSTLKKVKDIGYPAIQISGVGVQDLKIFLQLRKIEFFDRPSPIGSYCELNRLQFIDT